MPSGFSLRSELATPPAKTDARNSSVVIFSDRMSVESVELFLVDVSFQPANELSESGKNNAKPPRREDAKSLYEWFFAPLGEV